MVFQVPKSGLGEQLRDRPLGPELDVAVIPQWTPMRVKAAQERNNKIFQVAVVRRRDQRQSARFQ